MHSTMPQSLLSLNRDIIVVSMNQITLCSSWKLAIEVKADIMTLPMVLIYPCQVLRSSETP